MPLALGGNAIGSKERVFYFYYYYIFVPAWLVKGANDGGCKALSSSSSYIFVPAWLVKGANDGGCKEMTSDGTAAHNPMGIETETE